MYLLWIQAELIEMELLIAKGGSDVDRNYTTYSNDFSEENERDDTFISLSFLDQILSAEFFF